MAPQGLSRRQFVIAAGAALPGVRLSTLLRDPYARSPLARAGAPLRIRGRVRAGGRGLARVGVTDGLSTALTGSDGSYELVTTADRPFVSVSLPAGYRVPTNPTGTARLHRAIPANAGSELSAVFDLEPLPHGDERHTCLLLPDPQTETLEETQWLHEQTVPDVRRTVAALGDQEVFGVACGDLMFDHLELFPEYEKAVAAMGVPFFQVIGNHDMDYTASGDAGSSDTFSRHFGPRYYSFDRGAVHYAVLDDVFWHGSGYIGYLDDEQLTWLAGDLARIEPGRTVIVCLHIPVQGSSHVRNGRRNPDVGMAVMNREAVYRLLEPYRAHVLSGHTHESEHGFAHGVHEHVSGTVCGAWWSGPICGDGTPSGYSVYEIEGESVKWYYQTTGKDATHQVRVYPRGADPAAPDEIVANVWNWDPEWTVVWYEGGERRGEMSRRRGRDPLSVQLHTGPDLPPRRPWVEPYVTDHLFYAPVAADARDIRVQVVDRFKRVFDATL
jgi:hypothetical protein